MHPDSATAALLSAQPALPPLAAHDAPLWRAAHVLGFATGGITFIIGTALLMASSSDAAALASAVLYIVGSCGFLSVDVQEFLTFTEMPLRANIALNAAGSLLYVIGSAGYLPSLLLLYPMLGAAGFIGGSALIGIGEIWKLARLSGVEVAAESDEEDATAGGATSWRPSLRALCASREMGTAVGVEVGAGLGALLFLIGTALQVAAPDAVAPVLAIWLAGSIAFTAGAASLGWRHFVMGVT